MSNMLHANRKLALFFFLAPSYNVIVRSNFFLDFSFEFYMCVQFFGVIMFYKDKINFEIMKLDKKSKCDFVKAFAPM